MTDQKPPRLRGTEQQTLLALLQYQRDSLVSKLGGVDEQAARLSPLDELCRGDDSGEPVNLRLVLAHLLEETARHAGHADILRELIDGRTGR